MSRRCTRPARVATTIVLAAASIPLAATTPSFAQDAAPYRPQNVVDLSYALDEDFPWIEAPGTFPFSKSPIATIEGEGVAANAWTIHEHLGTQIDAPAHFAPGGRTMDEMRADELTAPIAVIDFKAEARADVDAVITVATLEAWEAQHGTLPQGAIVVMNSGWGARIGDPERYINLDETGTKRFPGFSVESVEWLMTERDAWGVGVDTISFDPGYDDTYATHRALEALDGWAIEALANLDQLPPVGATMFVGATNVRGATGGPVRPIAVWDDAAVNDASAAPQIEGRWRSAAPEPLPGGEGGTRYLTRDFTFADGRWSIDFAVAADPAGETVLFAGRNEGSYSVSPDRMTSGSYPAKFDFEARSLTPRVPAIADALTAAGCGATDWQVGEAQDVLAQGCEAFRIFSGDECAGEFDVVRIDGAQLFLGPRPADGFMCSEDLRPEAAGDTPLVRVEG